MLAALRRLSLLGYSGPANLTSVYGVPMASKYSKEIARAIRAPQSQGGYWRRSQLHVPAAYNPTFRPSAGCYYLRTVGFGVVVPLPAVGCIS